MSDAFVIRNQHGHYWGKSKAWVDGSEARTVFRTRHEDEAINTLVELGARDISLRGTVVAATLNKRGDPEVEASDTPLPGAQAPEPDADAAETAAEGALSTPLESGGQHPHI